MTGFVFKPTGLPLTATFMMEFTKNKAVTLEEMESPKGQLMEITAESVLDMLTQDHLKCHICLNTFTSPTYLDCLHTFCIQCLEDMRSNSGHSCNELHCPNCRVKTSLIGRGTLGLKRNFMMVSLVEEVASQKKLLRIQQGAVTCTLCNDEASAVIQCSDCQERLCQDCWMQQDSKHTGHHIDILDPTTTEKPPVVPKCRKHERYECCFYCKTCQALICAMCAATSHRSLEHEHLEIDEADDLARQELGILRSRLEKRQQDYISAVQHIKRNCERTEDILDNTVAKIETAGEYAEAEDEDQVLETLMTLKRARAKDFCKALQVISAKVEWVQHVYDYVSQQVADAGKYQLLRQKEELVTNIEETLANTDEEHPCLEATYNCQY
ncbi:E3 ubiquitin-protein ligase TRIM56-like [Acanthaster planci]|uniref:E3 ubiquitin-protein ligase TRIM56-like n=1 Tax=Acanthaster planci TaxID=133434 RepID=A0A8B7YAK3_ACAPL|nr:E3 ubiquitin-protein ligase TRIM56-like [Acanthaster planci]